MLVEDDIVRRIVKQSEASCLGRDVTTGHLKIFPKKFIQSYKQQQYNRHAHALRPFYWGFGAASMTFKQSATLAPSSIALVSASKDASCRFNMLAACHTAHLVTCCCD